MFKDCQGIPYPVFAKGVVTESAFVVGAIPFGSVSLLKVRLEAGSQEPAAGQFYMLHAVRSDVLLGRPISIYHSEKKIDGSVELSFLILLKGKGTRELCALEPGDKINLIGPCGNRFPMPKPAVVEALETTVVSVFASVNSHLFRISNSLSLYHDKTEICLSKT